jgi:G3E family GTPase
VHHNLREITSGIVRWRIQFNGRDHLTVFELAHGCVSCILREDLLPLLRKLARMPQVKRIVVRLDEAMEPEPVSWAVHNVPVGDVPVIGDVDLRAVFTVVHCANWLSDATGKTCLRSAA